MSQMLFRVGLWTIVAVFASYVLRETFDQGAIARVLDPSLLQKIGAGALMLLAASWVVALLERMAAKRKKRCALCKNSIPRTEIYCRQHLREIRDREMELSRRMPLR